MELKALFDDTDAVSPVIGVILMVAITVILAAVIGTFVLGLGEQVQQTQPNTQFSFDDYSDGGTLEIGHRGGDAIDNESITLVHDGERANNTDSFGTGAEWFVDGGDDEVVTGDRAVLNDTGNSSIENGEIEPDNDGVIIVWNPSDSDQSTELGDWEA